MRLQLNGEFYEFLGEPTLLVLLAQLGMVGQRIAVEKNGEIIARHQYELCPLQSSDRIEIIHAIGGG